MVRRALYLLCAAGLVVASCSSPDRPKPQSVSAPKPDPLYAGVGESDIKTAQSVVQKTLETQASRRGLRWQGENGVVVTVTPLRTFKIKTGHFCRDYQEVVLVGTVESTDFRRACRSKNGIWVQVPMDPAQSQQP